MSILKTIHSPADLKRLSPHKFPALCQEIREQIIGAVSNVGGHLASNLGVVELTVALQYLLDTPTDKIVWDTSNQSYTHKLLTGRREQFHTLRQYGGLSGFCKREESEYDTFNAGHAGTGVSAAFGMVEAREQLRQKHKVVCVVGDGAMTAGMTPSCRGARKRFSRDFERQPNVDLQKRRSDIRLSESDHHRRILRESA
jgi:1-deoxy-D-xylulose-5-phosphate synthase